MKPKLGVVEKLMPNLPSLRPTKTALSRLPSEVHDFLCDEGVQFLGETKAVAGYIQSWGDPFDRLGGGVITIFVFPDGDYQLFGAFNHDFKALSKHRGTE